MTYWYFICLISRRSQVSYVLFSLSPCQSFIVITLLGFTLLVRSSNATSTRTIIYIYIYMSNVLEEQMNLINKYFVHLVLRHVNLIVLFLLFYLFSLSSSFLWILFIPLKQCTISFFLITPSQALPLNYGNPKLSIKTYQTLANFEP